MQNHLELASDVHLADSEVKKKKRKEKKKREMVQTLHWLPFHFGSPCRPWSVSSNMPLGASESPKNHGAHICLPLGGGWHLVALHLTWQRFPAAQGSAEAACHSSLPYCGPSSLTASNHCLQADDRWAPHTQATTLNPSPSCVPC